MGLGEIFAQVRGRGIEVGDDANVALEKALVEAEPNEVTLNIQDYEVMHNMEVAGPVIVTQEALIQVQDMVNQ